MRDAVLAAAEGADVVVMAAAVADYRPETRSDGKIKKDGQPPEPLRLVENPDILAGLADAAGPRRHAAGPGRVRRRDGHLRAGRPGQARPQGV